jgi:hypothetical protein
VAHNSVLVNGQGQRKHAPDATGRIVAEQLTPAWDYIAGDATAAYGGRLTRALRHVAFVKGEAPLIVLYDDLAAREPSTFQFMLHALKPFTVNAEETAVSVEQPEAGVTAKYLCPLPLAFRQWDGFDPKPTREFPNQWHVEAGTRERRSELGAFTVIVPHRAGQGTDWKAERIETDTAVGVRVERGGRQTLIAFRKHGAEGEAAFAGQKFTGPLLVR